MDIYGNSSELVMTPFKIDQFIPTINNFNIDKTNLIIDTTANINISFNKEVILRKQNFIISHGTISNIQTTNNIDYTAIYTPNINIDNQSETIIIENYIDFAGNQGLSYTDTNYVLTIDTLQPIINKFTAQNNHFVSSNASVITIKFNKEIQNFTLENIEIGDYSYGSISNLQQNQLDLKEYTIDFQPTDNVLITITDPNVNLLTINGNYQDLSGNNGQQAFIEYESQNNNFNFKINTLPTQEIQIVDFITTKTLLRYNDSFDIQIVFNIPNYNFESEWQSKLKFTNLNLDFDDFGVLTGPINVNNSSERFTFSFTANISNKIENIQLQYDDSLSNSFTIDTKTLTIEILDEGDIRNIIDNSNILFTTEPEIIFSSNKGNLSVSSTTIEIQSFNIEEDGDFFKLTVKFTTLSEGIYNNNQISFIDDSGYTIDISIPDFKIDLEVPEIVQMSEIPNPINNPNPIYIFTSTKDGTLYITDENNGGNSIQFDVIKNDVVQNINTIEYGENTIKLKDLLFDQIYRLKVKVISSNGQESNILIISDFKIVNEDPQLVDFVDDGVFTLIIDEVGGDKALYPYRFIFTTNNVDNGQILIITLEDEKEDYKKEYTGLVFNNKSTIDIPYGDLTSLTDGHDIRLETKLVIDYIGDTNVPQEITKDFGKYPFEKICNAKTALSNLRVTKYANNIDPSLFTTIGRETGENIDFTKNTYDEYKMRRKSEVLQYNKQKNDSYTTKKNKYSQIMKGKGSHKLKQTASKNFFFTTPYRGSNLQLSNNNNSLLLTKKDGSECENIDLKEKSARNSDVPSNDMLKHDTSVDFHTSL